MKILIFSMILLLSTLSLFANEKEKMIEILNRYNLYEKDINNMQKSIEALEDMPFGTYFFRSSSNNFRPDQLVFQMRGSNDIKGGYFSTLTEIAIFLQNPGVYHRSYEFDSAYIPLSTIKELKKLHGEKKVFYRSDTYSVTNKTVLIDYPAGTTIVIDHIIDSKTGKTDPTTLRVLHLQKDEPYILDVRRGNVICRTRPYQNITSFLVENSLL